MDLPRFKYHPDPLATGSIKPSSGTCVCCGQARGYEYDGPSFGEDELDGPLCPWCIADGSAHAKLGLDFTDADGIGNYGDWDEVPEEVIEEITYRTPGFAGWQQERWWTCCGDGAAFLGRAGADELSGKWKSAVPSILEDAQMDPDDGEEYLESLSKEGSPTAYVFKCLHCGKLGGYSDSD